MHNTANWDDKETKTSNVLQVWTSCSRSRTLEEFVKVLASTLTGSGKFLCIGSLPHVSTPRAARLTPTVALAQVNIPSLN